MNNDTYNSILDWVDFDTMKMVYLLSKEYSNIVLKKKWTNFICGFNSLLYKENYPMGEKIIYGVITKFNFRKYDFNCIVASSNLMRSITPYLKRCYYLDLYASRIDLGMLMDLKNCNILKICMSDEFLVNDLFDHLDCKEITFYTSGIYEISSYLLEFIKANKKDYQKVYVKNCLRYIYSD